MNQRVVAWLADAFALRFKWQGDTISFHIGIVWIGLFLWWLLR